MGHDDAPYVFTCPECGYGFNETWNWTPIAITLDGSLDINNAQPLIRCRDCGYRGHPSDFNFKSETEIENMMKNKSLLIRRLREEGCDMAQKCIKFMDVVDGVGIDIAIEALWKGKPGHGDAPDCIFFGLIEPVPGHDDNHAVACMPLDTARRVVKLLNDALKEFEEER